MKDYFNIAEKVWESLPEPAQFVLVSAFLAKLLDDDFKRCVKKERSKGRTKEEAEKTCREREEYAPLGDIGDEVERSQLLLKDHEARYRPLIR